jgi:hypothetical protein
VFISYRDSVIWHKPDGRVMATRTKALSLSVSVTLANVQQVDAQLEGEVDATIDFGIGNVNVVFPFSIDTDLGSPITVDLGSVDLPVIGAVEIGAAFGFDLVARQLSAALTAGGVVVATTAVNY